jgi:two-component system response regulator MprA
MAGPHPGDYKAIGGGEAVPRPSGQPDGRAPACAVSRAPNGGFQEAFRSPDETGGVRILVVDDEPAVRAALERALGLDGFEVGIAEDGHDALRAVQRERPELVVLDVLMPGLDGIAVCRRLRRDGDRTPILMLTARDAVSDRVAGLDAGADDYLVKPFALEELLARVRALLRRTVNGDPHGVLRFADLSLDPATREVRRGEREIELTRTEFLLLELFLLNPRQVLPRALIFERVWGYDFGPTSNSLEVYVGYLRRKLESSGEDRLLQTVRGVGYVLRE